ncbi:hypothetical protein [endosymbiont of Ridgeia piscesae]|jgi:hypothetical protein|uniref:Uncharacterized protein n=1 Tax=endosymbiont of Ridgeia piscesae TaxID=54398 RepID=A0A0T5Z5Q4_9GAMM|nr:hypothetical protein [endosymbiont of Ridgeia piscesae]KRT55312.1 hypothetical protein Ga0074115_11670 [endosymbiont of Ridgeia piscesae]KRT58152.1 hypothetical protein Ga0076813_12922 [endosymbiont of Ridgeia piscesae]
MKIERLLCPLLLLILVDCGSQPQRPATSSSLDRWIEQQLIPHLQQRLTREPRLMGQPILIGGLRAGQISPLGDQLSHSIARRLTQGLLPQRSINLLSFNATDKWRFYSRQRACAETPEVHYLLGIEMERQPGAQLSVSVRILDLQENRWVSGVGLQWRGSADAAQLALSRQAHHDEALRGLRRLPFRADQPDLAAHRLASDLACQIRQLSLTSPQLYLEQQQDSDRRLQLVGHCLSRLGRVHLTRHKEEADLVMQAQSLPVSTSLSQYWVTLKPLEAEAAPLDIGSSIYSLQTVGEPQQSGVKQPVVRILSPTSEQLCDSPNPWQSGMQQIAAHRTERIPGCFAIEIEAAADELVFAFKQTGGQRLLRLSPSSCLSLSVQPSAEQPRRRLRLPSAHARPALFSARRPERYILLLAKRGEPATRLSRHLAQLADPCDQDEQPVISREQQRLWLEALEQIVDQHPQTISWRALEIGEPLHQTAHWRQVHR